VPTCGGRAEHLTDFHGDETHPRNRLESGNAARRSLGRAARVNTSHGTQTAAPQAKKQATIVFMGLAIYAMRLLEVMFFAGLAGSAAVVAISFIEDGKELFGKDEK
jgi:hypothetical protein